MVSEPAAAAAGAAAFVASVVAAAFGARFALPEQAADVTAEADVVFHTSAHGAGLATALSLGGLEATVVEMSWFGAGEVGAPLGEAFHSRRLKLISSQVGHVSPGRRPRWGHARRLAKALDLLADPSLDALIDAEVAFDDLPQALPRILSSRAGGLATVARY